MNKILKYIAFALGGLIVLALIVAGIVAIWWHRPRDKDVP